MIDLHAGLTGAVIYPFTYVVPSDNKYGTLEAREGIAKASGLPYVFRVSRERASHFFFRPGPGDYDVTFGGQCDQKKIPRVLVEMGEGGKITDEFVPVGIKAISNILKHLKMLPGKPELLLGKQRVFENYKQVRANRGGTLWMQTKVNAQVKKGDLLGRIYGPLDVMEEIVSPIDGVVLRVMTNAIVYPGAEVAWIIEVKRERKESFVRKRDERMPATVHETEVLIIGAGAAGAAAAIAAGQAGVHTLVLSKAPMAKTGITPLGFTGYSAVTGVDPEDSPDLHFRDTVIGGRYLCDQNLIEVMTESGAESVKKLTQYGLNFQKENGKLLYALPRG